MVGAVLRVIDRERRATGLPLGKLILASVVLHLVTGWFALNPFHPDEHFQILEFAFARMDLSPVEDLPWEFAQGMRSSLQPAMAMGVWRVLEMAGVADPFVWTHSLRILSTLMGVATTVGVAAGVGPSLNRAGRVTVWLAGLFTWFLPWMHTRFSSENLSGMAFAVAVVMLVRGERVGRAQEAGAGEGPDGAGRDPTVRPGPDVVAGVLLGLAFILRYQTGIATVGLGAWAVLVRRERVDRLTRVAGGVGAAVLAGLALDWWFYGTWTWTPWNYLRVNLLDGAAAGFGTSPWHHYLTGHPLAFVPPLGIVLAGAAVSGALVRARSPWSWSAGAFVIAHSMLAHKEFRFLLPLMYVFPVFLAYTTHAVAARTSRCRAAAWWAAPLALQNLVLLLLLATPAVHRGREVDVHYMRSLWRIADTESGPLRLVHEDPIPFGSWGLPMNVYRHPRIAARRWVEDADAPAPGDLLMLRRQRSLPTALEATTLYRAEPGYAVMARAMGAEDARWVDVLRRIEGWSDTEWARTVMRVEEPPRP